MITGRPEDGCCEFSGVWFIRSSNIVRRISAIIVIRGLRSSRLSRRLWWILTPETQRHHLLLNPRLIAKLDTLKAFRQPGFVWRKQPTLNTRDPTLDPILKRRPKKGLCVKLCIFVRNTRQPEQAIIRLFNVIDRKP